MPVYERRQNPRYSVPPIHRGGKPKRSRAQEPFPHSDQARLRLRTITRKLDLYPRFRVLPRLMLAKLSRMYVLVIDDRVMPPLKRTGTDTG